MRTEYYDVTIANGAALSGAAHFQNLPCRAVQTPASFEGDGIGFDVSIDGVTYVSLYDTSGLVNIGSASSRMIALPEGLLDGFPYVKVKSLTGGSAQNQTGAATVRLIGGA